MSRIRLLVSGLRQEVITQVGLAVLFAPMCNIASIDIVRGRSGKCRGFAYLEVESEKEASKILAFSGRPCGVGHTLRIEVVPLPPERISVRCRACARVFELYDMESFLPRHKLAGSRSFCEGSGEKGIQITATE